MSSKMSSDYADDSFSMETDQEYQEREIHIFERAKLDKNDFKLLQQNGDATMHEDYLDAVKQISLFLNSKVSLAEKNLQAKYGKTLVHTHCTAVMALLKGLMTMDETDLDFAMDAMRNAIEAASYLRKDQSIISSFSGMFFGTSKTSKFDHLKSLTLLQKHAELVYAEAYFLKALLSLITESNMVTFVKEGLAIRQAYSMYKVFYKFLNHIMQNEGPEGLLKHGIDNRFVTGVYLGIGGFNLMLSILPEKVLRIFEFIGFSGNRKFGMQCLALGANWELDPNSPIIQKRVKTKSATNFYSDIIPVETGPGSRKFICDIILSLYHVLLSTMVQLPGCDVPTASKVIQGNLEKNPDSFLYLIFKGKVSQANRQIKDAINEFTLVTEKQIDWRQLSHVCFWDIGVCYAAIGDWNKAAEYFDILYQENRWSKSIYLYMKAIFLYTADPVKNKVQVAEMLQEVPNHLKKVAGKSIPLEKFVARKSRKYFIQKERLLLPAFEILYMWNGFDLIPDEQLKNISLQLDEILNDLDHQQVQAKKKDPKNEIPYSTFYDDLCMARFFKGLAIRELAVSSSSQLLPETELLQQKLTPEQIKQLEYASKQLEFISLQADEIEYDHWILPFARYELGHLYFRMGKYEKAREEYQAALNGGYGEREAGKKKVKASMESSLHLRIHNAIQKLHLLQFLMDKNSAAEPEEESDEDD